MRSILASALLFASVTVAAAQQQSPPEQQPVVSLAEFWVEPPPDRDLFYGVGGSNLAPDPTQRYLVVEIKGSGYSDGYKVIDGTKREWSAKLPPEAHTEITASRIHYLPGKL